MYSQMPVRLAHFLGQGAIESEWMQNMQEKSMIGRLEGNNLFGTRLNPASSILESQLGHWYGAAAGEEDAWYRSNKYNSRGGLIASSYNWRNGNLGDPHAQQFRGRGFKQLTGLINYSLYWVYRGWLNESSFDDRWWTDTQYIARNPTRMRARPPVVDDPQRATSTPFNCMDTGGWYLVGMRPSVMRLIDDDNPLSAPTHADLVAERALSFSVTEAINGGRIQADDRLRETRNAKSILL
jgi:predicted chitinase